VDLVFRPDVDTDSGLVDEKDVRARRQPLAEADLLSVAAAKVADDASDVRGADIERPTVVLGEPSLITPEEKS
jgi:hypothetical protein